MTEFVEVVCYAKSCKVSFCIEKNRHAQLQRNGEGFYCLNGHLQSYSPGPSEAQKLRQENARLADQARLAQESADYQRSRREAAERSASAYKGQVTKIKKRVGRGVCPCCNRTFADLARHMAGKHPDFEQDQPENEAQ